jgi:predicted aspartyl protease
MVDTGANRSLISTAVADRLGIDHASAPQVIMNGVTGSAAVHAVRIHRIQAGELVLEDVQVPVIDQRLIGDADGILGVAGLRDMRLVVDFDKDRVTISGKGLWDDGLLRIAGHRVAGGLLAANARINRVRVIAVVDTGGQVTLGNRALQEALKASIRSKAEVMGTTDAVTIGDYSRIPDLEFGAVTIRRVQVAFGDFHIFDVWGLNDRPALIIGMDVLGAMDAFMIDFRKGEIHLRS